MAPNEFNLRHLRAMVAAARCGTLSAAARVVNLTQPALTQGIAKLERQIGVTLFGRRPGGMEPTEAALILTPRVEAALKLIGSSRVTAPQMRAFTALARNGSYAAAAAVTGVREPSLHRAVADLSLRLGQQLVERRGRRVALTARGQLTARRFLLAEAELRTALQELDELQGRDGGRIAIGAMPLSRARLLPNTVATFNRLHPQVEIRISEGSHADLIGPLRDGDIDLMVGALREPPPEDDIVQRPLFLDRPVIVGGAAHPLANRPANPSIQELGAYGWIVPPVGTPLRDQWRRLFSLAGVEPPRVAIECGSDTLVRQLLVQTQHLSLLSADQVAVELEAGWLVRIGTAPGKPSRTIGISTRSEWRPTRMQRVFLDLLEDQAKLIEGGN